MHDLIARVPANVFWAFVAGVAVGVAVSWSTARRVEAMRLAIRRAHHHWNTAVGDWQLAWKHATLTALIGVGSLAAIAALGYAVYLRVSGNA